MTNISLGNSIPRSGLVLEWLLDGNANDTAGTNTGIPVNVTWDATTILYNKQKANLSTATSNEIATPANPGISIRTICYWVYPVSISSQTQNWQFTTSSAKRLNMQSTNIVDYFGLTGVTTYINGVQTTTYTQGKWNFIVSVLSSNETVGSSFDFYIRGGGGGLSYNNIRIYNNVLTEAEIQLLYLEGLRRLGPANIASYPSLMSGLVYYADFKGTAHNLVDGVAGIVTGATLTTDRFGTANSAYDFTTTGQKISATGLYTTIKNIGNIFTIGLTCKIDTLTGGKVIFSESTGVSVLYLFTSASGKIRVLRGGTFADETGTSLSGTGVYKQIYLVFTSATNCALYINGAFIQNLTVAATNTAISSDLNIGNYYNTDLTNFWYDGIIDDFMVYNRALSADEVSQLYTLTSRDYLYPNKSYDLPGLRDGLVLDLNEQGKDLSGQGNDGTLVNSPAVIRQGKAKGLTYNGSTQYTTFGNILDENGSNPFSLSCWIKYTNTANQMVFGKQLSSGNFTGYMIWHRGTPDFKLEFTVVSTPTNIIEVLFPSGYTDGKRHHIVCTYDGSKTAGGCKGYIDGVAITLTTLANTLTGSSSTTAPLNIGARNDGNLPINGSIVNPKKYNKVLTPKQVESQYYSQKSNFIY